MFLQNSFLFYFSFQCYKCHWSDINVFFFKMAIKKFPFLLAIMLIENMFLYTRTGVYYSISCNPLCNNTDNFKISFLIKNIFEKRHQQKNMKYRLPHWSTIQRRLGLWFLCQELAPLSSELAFFTMLFLT